MCVIHASFNSKKPKQPSKAEKLPQTHNGVEGKKALNELGSEEHLPSRYFQWKNYRVPTLKHVIAIHPL